MSLAVAPGRGAAPAAGSKKEKGGLFDQAAPAATGAPRVGKVTTRPSDQPPAKVEAYEQLPVDTSLQDKRSAVVRMIRDGIAGGDQDLFTQYYNNYAFPRWTLPANLTALPKFRKELADDTRNAGEGGAAARAQLVELALGFLTKFAKGKYHPAVRYNAMLAIGDLYTQAAGSGRSTQPLAAALPVMLEAVKSADQIDAVRIAALLGILKHASLGIADQQTRDQEVVPTMLTVATTKVSPGRDADGHAWIRALAIDVLGEIGSVGQQNAVVTALGGIAANSETPFITRCAAARALGKLRYDPNAEYDSHQLAGQVARLAVDALAYEADQKPPDFESLVQTRRAGAPAPGLLPAMSFGAGGGGIFSRSRRDEDSAAPVPMPGTPGTVVDPERTRLEEEYSLLVRRRLLDRIDAVKDGLVGPRDERVGIAGLAKAPAQKAYIEGVQQQLDTIVSLSENEKASYDQLMKKIRAQLPLLRAAMDKVPSEKAEEGDQPKGEADAGPKTPAKAGAGAKAKAGR